MAMMMDQHDKFEPGYEGRRVEYTIQDDCATVLYRRVWPWTRRRALCQSIWLYRRRSILKCLTLGWYGRLRRGRVVSFGWDGTPVIRLCGLHETGTGTWDLWHNQKGTANGRDK
jgi:hypothetical protein